MAGDHGLIDGAQKRETAHAVSPINQGWAGITILCISVTNNKP